MAEKEDSQTGSEEATEMASPKEIEEAFGEEAASPFQETTPPPQTVGEEAPEEATHPFYRRAYSGSLRDRVAAALIDLLAIGYLYWGSFLAYNYFVWKEFLHPYLFRGNHVIIFHVLFFLVGFLYFFISEGVFFTSLGKFFCRLSVRNVYGGPAGLLAIALRNLFRPIDLALFFFPTWLLMEKTKRHQRLGDLIAGTIVTKHRARPSSTLPVEGKTASASARGCMAILDLIFLVTWLGGFLLWIDAQRPLFSLLLLLALPTLYLIWSLVWDAIFETSLGQWIFGCRLVREDGSLVSCSEAVIRAALRPFDLFTCGTLFLSQRHQTAADVAAGVVVVHSKRSWQSLIGILIATVIILGIWFWGMNNPNNFLNKKWNLNFLPKIFSIQRGGSLKPIQEKGLLVQQFHFLLTDRTTRRSHANFQPGETIYFSFDVIGFAVREGESWIQEDLVVRYPNDTIGFRKENIVDFHQQLNNPELPLQIINTLSLPANAEPGPYTLILSLHDRFANRHLTQQRTFRVIANPPQ